LKPSIVLVDNLRDGRAIARADSEMTQLLMPFSLVRMIEGSTSCGGWIDRQAIPARIRAIHAGCEEACFREMQMMPV